MDSDQIERFKDQLRKDREIIMEQDDLLNQLTANPLSIGVVVDGKFVEVNPDYRLGAKLIGTKYGEYEGETAEIVRPLDRDGEVAVQMDANPDDKFWTRVVRRGTKKPLAHAVFVPVQSQPAGGSWVLTAIDGKTVEMAFPAQLRDSIRPGAIVKVSLKTLQIVDTVKDYGVTGEIVIFRDFTGTGKKMVEVSMRGEPRIVFPGNLDRNATHEGDRLLLDLFGVVVMENLGQDEETFTFEGVNVTWDQVGGLEEAKATLKEAIELPLAYADLFKGYKKKTLKGAILAGPPGNGKTLLGKAAATAMNRVYRQRGPNPFLYIKGPELLNMYVGNTEAGIRAVFERARRYQKKYGSPVLIFFDEAEALFRRRGSGISTDVFDTIVPMMLAEMDGFEGTGAFVLLATNRLDLMDPALLRDGRISRIIEVDRPGPKAALEIFKIHLSGKPLNNGFTHADLARTGVEALFDPANTLFDANHPLHNAAPNFGLRHIVSGAMIEGIVDRATSIALGRDIKGKARSASGICKEDVAKAVKMVLAEQKTLDHEEELRALAKKGKYK